MRTTSEARGTTRTRYLLVAASLLAALVLFSVATLSTARPPRARALSLISAGKSPYTIVVAADALPSVQAAGRELQHYLELSTGLRLPIQPAPNKDVPSIVVGGGAEARTRGVDVSRYGLEEFSITTAGNDVVLAGPDSPGDPWDLHWRRRATTPTLSAVYAFLERFVGARWYWPGALGEEVPRLNHVSIPAPLEIRDRPHFTIRLLPLNSESDGLKRWYRRNGVGAGMRLAHWHNWFRILPAEKYYPEHPEYFALVDGRRGPPGWFPGLEQQICTSNKDVRRIFAEAAIAFFDENPDAIAFPMSANDGSAHCECGDCGKREGEVDEQGRPILTDRMFKFFNDVARRVAKRYPDRYLTVYAYANYRKASEQLRLEPNLIIFDVYNFASTGLWNPATRDQILSNAATWRKRTPNMVFMSYFYREPYEVWSLPQVSSAVIPQLLRPLSTQRSLGVFFSLDGGFAGFGHDAWLLSRLMWEPKADPEALLRDYYQGLFGPDAAPLVRRYHQRLQEAIRDFANRPNRETNELPEVLELYRPLRTEVTALLDQALEKVRTENQKNRLEQVRANWNYVLLSLDAMDAVSALDAELERNPERPDRAPLENAWRAVSARNEFVRAGRTDPDNLVLNPGRIDAADKRRCTPFFAARLVHLLEDRRYTVDALRIHAAPTPDDWARATPVSGFRQSCTTEPVEVQTEARVLYNDEALFFRLTAVEPDPAVMRFDRLTGRGGRVWTENTLEVLLDPGPSYRRYYQLMTNSLGAQFDELRDPATKAGWKADWKVDVQRETGRWTATFTVPFRALDATTPAPGTSWRMNLLRTRRSAPQQASVLAPFFGHGQDPLRFGRLNFR